MDGNKTKAQKLKIDLDPQTAQGTYCNLAMVNHNEGEFTLDFMYVQPQSPQAKVRARVISSPVHAKRLLEALRESVESYERRFGPVGSQQTVATPQAVLN